VADVSYYLLCEMLTFGSQSIQPGSFRWDGDSFTALPNELGVKWTGSLPDPQRLDLLKGTLRQVDERTFQILSPTHGSTFLVYDAALGLPPGWPSEVRRACERADQCDRVFKVVRVETEFETSGDPFDPTTYVASAVALERVISNSVVVSEPVLGPQHVEMLRAELGGYPPEERASIKRMLVVAVLLVLAMAPLVFMLLRRHKK
jgi:hypothetical protein